VAGNFAEAAGLATEFQYWNAAGVLLAALGLSLFGLVAAAERYFVFWGHQEST
jgi:hypothetical protein